MLLQPASLATRQLPDRAHSEQFEPRGRLGSNALDPAAGQWPDLLRKLRFEHDRHAVGAGEPRRLTDRRLNAQRQRTPSLLLAAVHLAEIDVHLVDTAILDPR